MQKRARLPALVPFWKPPNSTERTMRITISSTIHSRQPRPAIAASGRPVASGLNKDLYIRMCMPRHSAICRAAPNYLNRRG